MSDNLAFALATDPDAILDARRDSFACRACGSPDPAVLYGATCSDCPDVIAYTVAAPTEYAAIDVAVRMLRRDVTLLGVREVRRVNGVMWVVSLVVREAS